MRFALLRFVPQRFRTLECCVRMIRQNSNNLFYVPGVHYENAQFADWAELYWSRVKDRSITYFVPKTWHRGLRGVNFIGRGGEIEGAMQLLQVPWRDEVVLFSYVLTSDCIADLRPEDLTDAIFAGLLGRQKHAAEFIDNHQCDKVYQLLVKNSYGHTGNLFSALKPKTIHWLMNRGYFTQFPVKAYELPTGNIPDGLVLQVLQDITFLQAESVLQHPNFLRLYMQFHGIEHDLQGQAGVDLMYQLLSAYGPFGRPIQAMLMAHAEAMYDMAPIEFSEFVLDSLMRLRDYEDHKGLNFHQMVITVLADVIRFRSGVGVYRYKSMLNRDSLYNIRALVLWARWYFKIHRLEEILVANDSQNTWELAKNYASREAMMEHQHGRRLVLEKDMGI
jgi:hypothetical protein